MAANMATGKAQNSRKLPKAVKTASHSAPRKNRREELKGMLGHEHAACVRAQCNPIMRFPARELGRIDRLRQVQRRNPSVHAKAYGGLVTPLTDSTGIMAPRQTFLRLPM